MVNSQLEEQESAVQARREDDVDDTQKSGDDSPAVTHAPHRVKPQEEAKPTQLRFYPALWVRVLSTAKDRFRLSLYTTGHPFPGRDDPTVIATASDFILEACNGLRKDNFEKLDQSILFLTHVHYLLTT